MSSLEGSLELVCRELELARKRHGILEASYNARKINQATYEYIKKDLSKTLSELETRIRILGEGVPETLAQPVVDDLGSAKSQGVLVMPVEEDIKSSEDVKVFVSEGSSKGQPADVKNEPEPLIEYSCTSESGSLVTNTKNAESSEDTSTRQRPERGFYFYEDVQRPTEEVALSIEEFSQRVKTVSAISLEFHQDRGDFANWFREVLKNYSLAEKIEKLSDRGEALRGGLIVAIEGPKKAFSIYCPDCGTETNPKKTWKMKGKANKSGKSLQLTLGHYECSGCGKSFRKVLGKDLV